MRLFLKEGVGYYCYYGENGEHLYYHRLVASQKLGRNLKEGEVVHHIDGNKLNNNPNNLLVFRTGADHSKHHNFPHYDLLLNEDGSYSFDNSKLCKPCKLCGELTRNVVYCSKECENASYKERLETWINVEELEKLLLTTSFAEIGRMYGLTDSAIRKRCCKLGLPSTKEEKIIYFDLPYYTDEELREMYGKGDSITEIHRQTGVSKERISKITRDMATKEKKKINVVDHNKIFDSVDECAKWLITQKLTSSSLTSVKKCIGRVLRGERKTYLKLSFAYQ